VSGWDLVALGVGLVLYVGVTALSERRLTWRTLGAGLLVGGGLAFLLRVLYAG
jgi:hypothetical protein